MATDIVYPRALAVKCAHCFDGQSVPERVCHHCGLPFCASAPPIPEVPDEEYVNLEFQGLPLPGSVANGRGVHCQAHQHGVRQRGRRLRKIGLWVLILGLAWAVAYQGWLGPVVAAAIWRIAAVHPALPWGVAASGLLLMGTARLIRWITFTQGRRRQRPPFPVFPVWERLQREEKLALRISQQADWPCDIRVGPIQGTLALHGRMSSADHERWEQFRRLYGRLGAGNFEACLGFLALRAGSSVQPGQGSPATFNAGVAMLKDYARAFPYLDDPKADPAVLWRLDYEASLPSPREGTIAPQAPIQWSANLTARGSRRQIELHLYLRPDLVGRARRIEHLTVNLNPAWGEVQECLPKFGVAPTRREAEGPQLNVHRWSRITIEGAQLPVFLLRFEHPLAPSDLLTGSFEVVLRGGLAELDVVGLYDPLGYRIQGISEQQETVISGTFELSLAALTYPEEAAARAEVFQQGAIPDHHLITRVTSLLAGEGYYIKNIEENPPADSRAGAHIQLRAWDIKGRRYLGLQPVDFHLVITGDEHYEGGDLPTWGNARVEITTQGSAATAERAEQVHKTAQQIEDLVREGLSRAAGVAVRLLEAPEEPGESAAGEEDEGEPVSVESVRKRLEQLEELFMEGRITPEQYMELKDRYQRVLERAQGRGGVEWQW